MKRSILDDYLAAHPGALDSLAHQNLIRPFVARGAPPRICAFERALDEGLLHYSETTQAVLRGERRHLQICYSLKMRLSNGAWRLLDAGRLSRRGHERLQLRKQFAAENLSGIIDFFESVQRRGRGQQRRCGFCANDLLAAWYGAGAHASRLSC